MEKKKSVLLIIQEYWSKQTEHECEVKFAINYLSTSKIYHFKLVISDPSIDA